MTAEGAHAPDQPHHSAGADAADAAAERSAPAVASPADEASERVTDASAKGRHRLWTLSMPLAAMVVLVDQLTKDWALGALADGRARHVIWTLHWNLTFNSGMAFSKGQGVGPIIALAAVVVVVVIATSVRHSASRTVDVAAGLVMGGAVGNLVDRLFRGDGWLHGAVVDFIDFQWFPIFNVADIAVNVGGGLFILWSLFAHHEGSSRRSGPSASGRARRGDVS